MRIWIFVVCFVWLGQNFAQSENDDCNNATVLCPNDPITFSNENATIQVCATCPDGADNTGLCGTGVENTIWLTFTSSAAGGNASLNISGLNFNSGSNLEYAVVLAGNGCDQSNYSNIICGSLAADGVINLNNLASSSSYYVQLDGENAAVFNGSATISGPGVDVNTMSASVSAPSNFICNGEYVLFTAQTQGCTGAITYEWTVDGNVVATSDTNTINLNGFADGSAVGVNVYCNGMVCSQGVSNQITMDVDTPVADAGPDQFIVPGGKVTLQAASSHPDFYWGPNDGLSSIGTINPVASPSSTTTYYLTVTSPFGCVATDDVVVVVRDPLGIVAILTPNGDNYNDEWYISGAGAFPDIRVSVFDRWGQQVFKSIGYEENWDGTNAGRLLPAGVYFYVIELNDGSDYFYKGYVTLLY